MKYRSRFDRYLRLMSRCRVFLEKLNRHSDRLECERSEEAEKHYRLAKRLIADINKEMKKL